MTTRGQVGRGWSRIGIALVAALAVLSGGSAAWGETLQEVLKRRELTQQDVLAAAKTYVPTGKRDEFIAFSSGGQSGMVIVYGIPSMRLLKYIAVFNREPWQAYGFDEESKAVLAQGRIDGRDIDWGDTHHPALSETNGDYDGQYLFINDKANPRLAVIDLHDFETKQIVTSPIFQSEHGGAFVSENTEYVDGSRLSTRRPWAVSTRPSSSSTRSIAVASPTGSSIARKGLIEPENSFAHRAAALQPGPVGLRQAGPSSGLRLS